MALHRPDVSFSSRSTRLAQRLLDMGRRSLVVPPQSHRPRLVARPLLVSVCETVWQNGVTGRQALWRKRGKCYASQTSDCPPAEPSRIDPRMKMNANRSGFGDELITN